MRLAAVGADIIRPRRAKQQGLPVFSAFAGTKISCRGDLWSPAEQVFGSCIIRRRLAAGQHSSARIDRRPPLQDSSSAQRELRADDIRPYVGALRLPLPRRMV